jgi:hypothetical protein
MYGMGSFGPPGSRTRLVMATTITNPSGVAVGGGLTGGMAYTQMPKGD